MILFSQQIETMNKIYNKFYPNSSLHSSAKELERYKIFLNPKKYEGKTIQDFKLIVLWTIFRKNPKNKVDLLCIMNDMSESDIKDVMKFKRILESYEWQKNEDLKIIKDPMTQYRRDEITFLGLYYYYKKHPEKIKGRILKRELKNIETLLKILGAEK